jgi:hypothetical protein
MCSTETGWLQVVNISYHPFYKYLYKIKEEHLIITSEILVHLRPLTHVLYTYKYGRSQYKNEYTVHIYLPY